VICDKCGAVLYEGKELKAPYEVGETYDGKCPNCGKKLSYTPKKVEIKPAADVRRRKKREG